MKLKSFKDSRGMLFPVDFNLIPFKCERVFLVYDVPKNTIRGNHAHYNTQQFLICVKGEIEVILNNGIKDEKTIIKQTEYVFVDKLIWDSQVFLTGNDILMVLCSTGYTQEDYITDYNKFKEIKLNYDR